MKYVNIIDYSKSHDNWVIAITACVFNTCYSLRKSVLRTGTVRQYSGRTYRAAFREQNKQKKNFKIFTCVLAETNKIMPDREMSSAPSCRKILIFRLFRLNHSGTPNYIGKLNVCGLLNIYVVEPKCIFKLNLKGLGELSVCKK